MSLALAEVKIFHQSVMVKEVLEALLVRPGGRYLDCTVGEGGHALAILETSAPGGRLLGLDADPEALETAERRLQQYRGSLRLANASFAELTGVISQHSFWPVDGALMDLGLSSLQLEGEGRGFSFMRDEPLDMRFNPSQGITAHDIVNSYPQGELARVIAKYGEQPRAHRIARAIVENRPISTSLELARVVGSVVQRGIKGIHPATRTFQALRMEVNDELSNLESGFKQAIDVLGRGGRLAVISYHSLEDRVVKGILRREASDCICPPERLVCVCGHRAIVRLINRKVITPSPAEVLVNPRSRSARMRVAERV